jgi:succinate dehydrogenase/fumarate reductase flavoprotein subunit
MAAYNAGENTPEVADAQVQAVIGKIMAPFNCPSGEDVYVLRDDLKALMGEKAGLVWNPSNLESAQKALTILRERAQHVHVSGSPRLSAEWQEWLNLDSLLSVSNMIIASALQRKESRGADFRSDSRKPTTAPICRTSICSAREREYVFGWHRCNSPGYGPQRLPQQA